MVQLLEKTEVVEDIPLTDAPTNLRLVPVAVGELVYTSLDEAERVFFDALDAEERTKIDQIVAVLEIKRRRLYEQRVGDDGQRIPSFEAYLKSIEPRMERRGVGKASSIKGWIAAYRVYCEQLGFDRDWLLQMGAHAKTLIKAANLSKQDSVLEYENLPTPEGGWRLGHVDFKELSDEIADKVLGDPGDVPELSWRIADTARVVRETLGKPEPLSRSWRVEPSGADVIVKELTFWIGDPGEAIPYHFTTTEVVPFEHFQRIAGRDKVEGLEGGVT